MNNEREKYYIDCDGDIWKHDFKDRWWLYNKRNHEWSMCYDHISVSFYIEGDYNKPSAKRIDDKELFLEMV